MITGLFAIAYFQETPTKQCLVTTKVSTYAIDSRLSKDSFILQLKL